MPARIRRTSLNSEVTGRLREYASHSGPYENTAIHAYVLACEASDEENVYRLIDRLAAGGEREVTLGYAIPAGVRDDLEMRGFSVTQTDCRRLGESGVGGHITTITW